MRYAIKNKKKTVKAYRLGAGTEMEKALVAEGAIRLRDDGRYELFSQEVKGETGQVADVGDYIKVDIKNGKRYPYHNLKKWFEANHTHLEGDEYEQISRPVEIWEVGDKLDEKEIVWLTSKGKLVFNQDDEENYFSAKLWGTKLTQSKDAVVVIYSVTYDEKDEKAYDGKKGREYNEDNEKEIADIDFGLVGRKDFNENYTVLEHHVLMLALSTFNNKNRYERTRYCYYDRSTSDEENGRQKDELDNVSGCNDCSVNDKDNPELKLLYECFGFYQLESIPQFINGYLKSIITDVVMLETKDARTKDRRDKVEFYESEDIALTKEEYGVSAARDDSNDQENDAARINNTKPLFAKEYVTAAEYFREWIQENLGGSVNIIEIDVDEMKPVDALTKTLKTVRKLYDETKDKNEWRLWIDTHGGFRDIALVLVSASRFFATDRNNPIRTNGIYTVYYTPDKRPNEIVNQTAFYFAESAENMRQFLNYGQYLCDEYPPYDGEKPYAFVSYKHKKNHYVSIQNLFKKFKDNDIRFWYDDGIPYRADWRKTLEDKNKDAAIFIGLLSNEYFESVECWRELLFAIKNSKRGSVMCGVNTSGVLEADGGAVASDDCIHLVLLDDGIRLPENEEDLKAFFEADIKKHEDSKEKEKLEKERDEVIRAVTEIMQDLDLCWDDVKAAFATDRNRQHLQWFKYIDPESSLGKNDLEGSKNEINKDMQIIRTALVE